MVSRNRLAYSVLGAAAAVVAAGAAAGGVVVSRKVRSDRPDTPHRFEDLHPDRSRTVRTEDGVTLQVEEIGPLEAPLTVVFSHGFTLSMRAFYYQEAALRQKFGDSIRMVFYDQRGHGQSGPSSPAGATIDQLGHDLHTVIDAVVPTGPVVLVGHSMGGMTVLAYAKNYAEMFRAGRIARARRDRSARVVAVALICTSAGGLAGVTLGLPSLIARLRGPLAPLLLRGARRQAALVERSRRIGADVAWVITRRLSFGGADVAPEVVDFLNDLISATTIEAIADFYPALMSFDVSAGLATLAGVDVLIVGADHDVLTPLEHSRVIAAALPQAEFIELADVGHVAILEAPDAIDSALIELVARAAAGVRR